MTITDRAASLRADLPFRDGTVYFNHAARGPTPGRVVEAVRSALELDSIGEQRGPAWRPMVDATREKTASFLGVSASEVAFVQNTSTGLSIAAAAIGWKRGDNVVVSLAENPANLTPWLHLAERGVETRCAPTSDACVDIDGLLDLVDERTRLVAVSAVEYTSGQRTPLARIGDFCRERGVLLVVDGAQALGAVPLDIKGSKIDILASGGCKWLMAPSGIGILFVDERLHEELRTPLIGEHAIHPETDYTRYPDMVMRPGAMRFEAGAPNVPGIAGLAEALTIIEEVGIDAISTRLEELTGRLAAGLEEAGMRVISPRDSGTWSGIVTFQFQGVRVVQFQGVRVVEKRGQKKGKNRDRPYFPLGRKSEKRGQITNFSDSHGARVVEPTAREVANALRDSGIVVAARRGYIRVSPHWYNSDDQIGRFLEILKEGTDN
jgi:cysteine desulfurase/selenocysteine lyase